MLLERLVKYMQEIMSRSGVYHNIDDSTYFYVVDNMTYYFVSKTNRDRFVEKYKVNRDKISQSLSNRFKVRFNANALSDLRTYLEIEKKGFYVLKGGERLCRENLEYDIQMLINNS